MSDPKTEIRDLVAAARLEEALILAKKTAQAGFSSWDTPVTLLQSELEYLSQCEVRGVLTPTDLSAKRQQIAFRLLTLLDDPTSVPDRNTSPADPQIPRTTILFLGANPFHNLALELDREVQLISEGLQHFGKRQAFDFRAKMHVTPTDLQRMLLEADLAPRFVHFAGNAVVDHPDFGTGVVFEKEDGTPHIVSGAVLATILRQFPSIECVFVNTCDSGPSALEIGQHVPYAIGMNDRIYDESAVVFAVAFYEAIASGKDIPFAFEFAKGRLLLERFPNQATIPVLITNGHCPDPVYVHGPSHISELSNPRVMR
ncbi:MAG: hypothetical protein KIPDCIKN_02471 [Haliscomenobacter sp.]|nr:hypothetical protein [Haliscomenobacter sp.]